MFVKAIILQHESTAAAHPKRQLFFNYYRRDYDYTQPWAEMCGLPLEGFGPTEMAQPQKGRCKNRACAGVLRSDRPDGKLELKEKIRHPLRPGTPEKPQYVVVNFRCPPEIPEDGKLKVNVAAFRNMRASH